MYGDITHNTVMSWIQGASQVLGEDVVYNDELIAQLKEEGIIISITEEHYKHNDALLSTQPLHSILDAATHPLRLKGQAATELRSTLKGVNNRHRVIDILQNGQRKCMVPEFKPNGGREVSFSGSYRNKYEICNQSIFELQSKGQVMIFSKDALAKHGCLSSLHISTLVWATKMNKILGRTCLHASKSSRNHPSYNESIDYTLSDQLYPMPKLPLLPDIADLACQQRELYPGEQLAGATVDVTSAYNQCPMTTDAAKLTATQIRIPNGARGWIHLIVIYLVCIFGCTTAGNVYCQCAIAIDQLHNPKGRRRRSLTYIDDGMIIEPQKLKNISKELKPYLKKKASI
jgi:hypothetical protein